MMIRTRFAPSPTGSLHIGGVRTALYCYALAKKHRGEYLLRIEDTDLERYQEGSIEEIIEMLRAYGVFPDRYPSREQMEARKKEDFYHSDWLLHAEELRNVQDQDFDHIYIQTLRIPLYQKYALSLLEKKFAYLCFCSKERLAKLRKSQQLAGKKPGYDGSCKQFSWEEALDKVKKGAEYVVRLNVDAYREWKGTETVSHEDRLMGKLEFSLDEVDDQILIKSNGVPTYHLAVVVDDHCAGVTHPMRAVEWISSTPKQVMLYELLGWEMPRFTHLTAILDPSGGKLSKRKGSVAAKDFLKAGYLPEAVLNFLMLLGWSPGDDRELFSLGNFVKEFSLEGLTKSNPVFDRAKLDWFNGVYIRERISSKEYHQYFYEFSPEEIKSLPKAREKLNQIAPLLRERLKRFAEVPELISYFFKDELVIEPDLLVKQAGILPKVREMLGEALGVLREIRKWEVGTIETVLRSLGEEKGWRKREFFMTVRVAVTGQTATPPLFDTLFVLGREKVLTRLRKALEILPTNY